MKRPHSPFLSSLALLGCCFATVSVCAQGISTASPFLPQGGAAVANTPTENTPLELRGIMSVPNGYLFGLFDPARKLGAWVKLNEPGHEFTVRSHDVQNDSVTVEYQGRVMTLAMKTAPIQSAPGGGQMTAMPRPPSAPGNVAANSVSEDQRLERVAAEVRRRRAARQAAAAAQGQRPAPPVQNQNPSQNQNVAPARPNR